MAKRLPQSLKTLLKGWIWAANGLYAVLPTSLRPKFTRDGGELFNMGGSAAFTQDSTKWNPPASSQASHVTITQNLSTPSKWAEHVFHRLDQLKSLEPDWDGYGSPKITEHAL